jgi:protein-S-isoprenylcysteine O-methyltransferase Ste14
VVDQELHGVVVTGRGRGAELLADERVLDRIEEVFGLRVVPGTLNVRLSHPFDRTLPTRYVAGSDINPDWEAATGQAGYHLAPVLVAERYRGVAFQADEPGYPEDLVEIMCEVHLRSVLGLEDGDPFAATVTPHAEPRLAPRAGRNLAAALGSSVFFVLAPGVVAGLIPWRLTRWRAREPYPWPIRVMGVVLLVTGVVVVVSAFARFVREGSGTPAPVAPTRRLVIGGLYRHVRNPMYVAVLAAIVGQAFLLGRPRLLVYGAVVAIAFATFVQLYEEPRLLRAFGAEYEEYRRAVPGWWPRLRPWRGGGESPRP